MPSTRIAKADRQQRLQDVLQNDPFLTDEELAQRFGVSVQTIRLDRLELSIPEYRERIKEVAEKKHSLVKSLGKNEVIGDLLELELGDHGMSLLEITPEMVFARTGVARGYHLFAQVNSLAIAIIDADVVLTGISRVKYKRPAYVGNRLIARAKVLKKKGSKYVVRVNTTVQGETVLTGTFLVSIIEQRGEDE